MSARAALRGAFLGAGNVALHGHLPGWLERPDVAIVAAADTSPAARPLFEARLPGLAWYGSAEDLLARERIDFVDVCTPPAAHAPLIRFALERGLHVLCEKPLVLDHDELSALAKLAREKGRVLATVHNWTHAPALMKARALVRAGAVGEIARCRWEVLRERPAIAAGGAPMEQNWRLDPAVSGGGILVDHGWHAVYSVIALFGAAPREVWARLSTRKHRQWPVEDTAEVRLEFPSGRAEILLTWAADRRANRVEIEGSDGSIEIEGTTLEVTSADGTRAQSRYPESLAGGSHHPDWFGAVAQGFLDEIAQRRPRGATVDEAFLCLAVIEAARESNRSGDSIAPAGVVECAEEKIR